MIISSRTHAKIVTTQLQTTTDFGMRYSIVKLLIKDGDTVQESMTFITQMSSL